MKILNNVSALQISWVKSYKKKFSGVSNIQNLYYPESIVELKGIISEILSKGENFDIFGYSSNTLFLPSYHAQHVICTKKLGSWSETEDSIICECGVAVSKLSKWGIDHGFVGFEGLTDLPGTIAAAVYGNCGCRGCSVNSMVKSISILNFDGVVREYTLFDLEPTYRSTSLKRQSLKGVVLYVTLHKKNGNSNDLKNIAERNHQIRINLQPSGYNNLGTTFNGGTQPTLKGFVFICAEKIIRIILGKKDSRVSYPILLKLIGKSKFIPYVYYWNRYLFLDEKSHELFNEYFAFVKTLYKDARLEIEIKK